MYFFSKIAAILLIALVLIAGIGLNAFAASGILHGQVLDLSTGRPVPSANLSVENLDIGAATDLDGHFRILHIPIGTHNIRISCLGYRTLIKSDVFVSLGDKSSLIVHLEPSPIEMEDVVVEPSFFAKSRDAAASFHSMDWAEIRIDPGSVEDVQRSIQALPSVVSGSDQLNEIIVRGGMPNENLFLLDNIEIPNPNHFGQQGEGGGPINMLHNDFVRKVDFYAGAFPARYGDRASSVMDIQLREGNMLRYSGNVNVGMAGAGIMVEGPISREKSSFMFSARRSFLDLIISSTGLTAVPQYHNAQAKIDVELNPRNHLSLNGVYGHDYISIEENDKDAGYARGVDEVISQGDQIVTGGTLRTLWGANGFSLLTLSHVISDWEQDVWEADGKYLYYNTSHESETALKFDLTWKLHPKHDISFGFQGKYINADIDRWADADTVYLWDTNFKDTGQDTITGVFYLYRPWIGSGVVDSYKTGLYLQYSVRPWTWATFRAGCRWDRFEYTGAENLSPRVSLSVQTTRKTTVNMAYGEHAQTPPYIDLTMHPANRDLESKISRHVVFGIEYLLRPDTKATVELYYKDNSSIPIRLHTTTADPFDPDYGRMINQGKGDSKGVEFFLQKKFSHNYHGTISLALYRTRAVDPRNHQFYDWDYDHRYVLTMIGGYRIRFGKKHWYQHLRTRWWYLATAWLLPLADEMEIGVRWRYLGGRPYTEPIYHRELHSWVVEEDQPWNNERHPPYHRLDLRIDRRFFFKNWNLVTYFDIMNIYGRDNIWNYSRNDLGEVEEIWQWKVFPVGGMVIEF